MKAFHLYPGLIKLYVRHFAQGETFTTWQPTARKPLKRQQTESRCKSAPI